MKSTSLITYSASHFLVDFACGYALFSMYTEGLLEADRIAIIFILYDLLAFGVQYIFGAIADKLRSNGRLFAVAGIAATALGICSSGEEPYLTVLLLGLGNAAFHIGGGIDSLCEGVGMTRAGIFVSTGSLGIALGCKLGEKSILSPYHCIAMLIFAAVSVWASCGGERQTIVSPQPAEHQRGRMTVTAVITASLPSLLLLLFAILIRSYGGAVAVSPESDSSLMPLLIAAAAFAGKLAGGILADLIGGRRIATAALLLCVPLFYLGAEAALFFIAATFLFNIAMPITLVTAARKLPGHESFVFGITTLALFLGYFISTIVPIKGSTALLLVPLLSLIAAVAVFLTADNIRVTAKR